MCQLPLWVAPAHPGTPVATPLPHTVSQQSTDRERQLSERAGHTETPATGQRASHTRDEAAAERDTGGERTAAQ